MKNAHAPSSIGFWSNLIKVAAVASILGAITTALLIYLPSPQATSFDEQVALSQNGLYLSKVWILFFHPQLNFIAALGVAVLLFRKYPVCIMLGLFFFLVWCLFEMTQQAFILDAVNQYWRPGFAQAEDDEAKVIFRTLLEGSRAWSDSYYFELLYSYGMGSLLFGLAFVYEDRLIKSIGIAYVFVGLVSLLSFIGYYVNGFQFLSIGVNLFYDYIYPILQPAVRLAMGVWLWQGAKIRARI